MNMPTNAGAIPAKEKKVMSVERRPAMKSERPSDNVSKLNNYPVACANSATESLIACRNMMLGTTKEPVKPVSTPVKKPARPPTKLICFS